MTQVQNILDVRGVSKTFTLASGIFRRDSGTVRALDDISFSVPAGSTVGLVGESGCRARKFSSTAIRTSCRAACGSA
jgi:ABC-type glutathione transport system ATPase component